MSAVTQPLRRGYRTLCLPISETDYERFMTENAFAEQARELDPADALETVNTDGWAATQGAWKRLFPSITVILCFLHAVLKIRDHALNTYQFLFPPLSKGGEGGFL
jgi:hypothetical protein